MKKNDLMILAGVVLLFLSASGRAQPSDEHCHVGQLTVHMDDRDGEFDGMSQRGTLLVMRNTGTTACTLPSLPTLTFEDDAHRALVIKRRVPRGMHPGPVLLPVVLMPGGTATVPLRWVGSDVFDGGTCVRPASILMTLEAVPIRLPFDGILCAAAGQAAYFDQAPQGVTKEHQRHCAGI